jgi:cytochrome c biogenesis protein CcmG, thiol:disulfide interchange protein DsbE
MKTSLMTIGKCAISSILAILLLTLAACSREPFERQKPAVGETAPVISVSDLSGKMLRLADYRGKVVLVNFWASWCPPCKDEMPWFQKVYLENEDKGFVVIGVAINEITAADVKALGLLFPVVTANERVKHDYGDIANPPVSFLVGRDGRIIKKVKGVYSEDELRKDVQQALKR